MKSSGKNMNNHLLIFDTRTKQERKRNRIAVWIVLAIFVILPLIINPILLLL